MNGLVLVDKPAGCTSHDIVSRWRKLAATSRTGHLGTLDPMATGLLLLVSGSATRLAPYFSGDAKTYEAEITLGLESNTYDIEGELQHNANAVLPDRAAVVDALDIFQGRFLQMPPAVSAKKIRGVPAYKLARQNKPVDLQPVPVEVHRLTLDSFSGSKLEITVQCSAGTYIRSIAHDLGKSLGCGAVLSRLRRTHVGTMSVEKALPLDSLIRLSEEGNLASAVIPIELMLPEIPIVRVDDLTVRLIRNGREFRSSPFVVPPGAPIVQVLSRSGDLIALGELIYPNAYHPKVVL